MHWFDSQIQVLQKLAEAYDKSQDNNSDDFVVEVKKTRSDFIDKVQFVVDSVAKFSGITGCVASHDGFILAKAGVLQDTKADVLSAVIQENISNAQRNKNSLDLGDIEQIVIVGKTNKIAMISIGQLTLGILSSAQTNLTKQLRKAPC